MGIVSAVVLIHGATGSHGGHSQLHTTSMMKGVFFLSFATIAAGAGTYETELLRGIDIYNFRSKCWGKSNVDKYAVDMENAKRGCMQMEPAFDFHGHGDGPQNPFLSPNSNPFEKLTRGGDFSDLQSLWRPKRDASEGLVDVDEEDFYEFLKTFYGSESDEETAERIASIGLPENKYDAAAVSIAVLQNAMSEEEKFVERFLWDLDGDKF